ncbi:hypothetical protein CSOJ01_04311 [Colletotrichum sojae]|uniref:Uncharacterized protein n=1 Tax=Colletotrichum sojae TaxID=2175907 RepID=A0A8H6MZH2_9PEZI|nr:hypothetical protein CSOJ01_04311 [Colletotrichum sojae]
MDQNRYPAWRVIKDGTSFNLMIEDVGKVIADRKWSMTAAEYEVNKQLFDGVERAMEGIKLQRQADHHKHLIPDLKAALPDIDFKTDQVLVRGEGQKEEILNVQKTIDDNTAKVPHVGDKLDNWLRNHYATDVRAQEHKLVMNRFELGKYSEEGQRCVL